MMRKLRKIQSPMQEMFHVSYFIKCTSMKIKELKNGLDAFTSA